MQPEPRWLEPWGKSALLISLEPKVRARPPRPCPPLLEVRELASRCPAPCVRIYRARAPPLGGATFDRGTGARAYDDDAARHMPPPRAGGARPPPARRHHLYRTPAATTTRPTCMRASRVSLVSSRQRSSAMERRVLRVLIRRARRRRPSTSSRSSTTSSRVRSTRTPPST